jgi:hypothetical protein
MTVQHTVVLSVRIDRQTDAMIAEAARTRGMKQSEWLRQAVRLVLEIDGFGPGASAAKRTAGALYDLVEGRKRYALIEDGRVKDAGYYDAKPDDGRTWLPVTHVDSEPFDEARHWRSKPHWAVVDIYGTPDRVIVTYPVVEKLREGA